jgi:hypothetical protein
MMWSTVAFPKKMERRPEEHDRAKMGQFMGVAFWFASVPWMGETGECWESWVKNWEKNWEFGNVGAFPMPVS